MSVSWIFSALQIVLEAIAEVAAFALLTITLWSVTAGLPTT